ncbi:MAG TPA: hypothetical protein VG942_00715 [Hyphomonadaceae bacterium]|nr:hypothetical protein [Hyphomonadaceae bacterium]
MASDHEDFLNSLKSPSERGERPFLTTGKFGNETVVPWLIIAAALTGLLTRSVIGAIAAAVVVFALWFIVMKAFGGRFMSTKMNPSRLFRFCLIGGVAGFIADFGVNAAGISISLVLATTIGVAIGLALYQLVPERGKK